MIGRRSASASTLAETGTAGQTAGFAADGGVRAGGETGDRPQQPLAMPERHADLFEVGFDQVGQDVRVDLILAEQRFVLSEADRVQPLGDVHRRSRTVRLHDGPRETASPGRERWPAAMGSI